MKNTRDTIEKYFDNNIRVSVSNLVSRIEWEIVWIINKNDLEKNWIKRITSIWWWAQIYSTDFLKRIWAKGSERNENWDIDARFYVDREKINKIISIFTSEDNDNFELSIERELREELTEETIWEQEQTILNEEDLWYFAEQYIWFYIWKWMSRRIEWEETLYIWNYFDVSVSEETYIKLVKSPYIHFLSPEEIRNWISNEWIEIWENIRASL